VAGLLAAAATVLWIGASPTALARPAAGTRAPRYSTRYLLGHLKVRDAHYGGYRRSKFRLWTMHPDGCNTRYQVLIRDAVRKPQIGPGCYLTHGRWVSPYDGVVTTDPVRVQIDHVVPLAVAWGSGAWRWTAGTRRRFANDLGTRYDLLAVSGRSNQLKGDSGPDEWLPPRRAFDCRYMADYTAVLWRWRLSIDPTEKAFLDTRLARCGWPRTTEPKRPRVVVG
jgi:Protein of unknown function (DUF1524)